MSCATDCKCGSRRGLCPVSLGMACGLTWALAAFLFGLWVMHFGMPPMMAGRSLPEVTYMGVLTHAFWALLKGFGVGFFVALFYDFISCFCKARCCKKSCNCGSGCSCCSTDKSACAK